MRPFRFSHVRHWWFQTFVAAAQRSLATRRPKRDRLPGWVTEEGGANDQIAKWKRPRYFQADWDISSRTTGCRWYKCLKWFLNVCWHISAIFKVTLLDLSHIVPVKSALPSIFDATMEKWNTCESADKALLHNLSLSTKDTERLQLLLICASSHHLIS